MTLTLFTGRPMGTRPALLCAVAATALFAATPGNAQDRTERDAGLLIETPVADNQEVGRLEAVPAGPEGFSITLGDTVLAGDDLPDPVAPSSNRAQRSADISLEQADIQLRVQALEDRRLLNVRPADLRTEYRGGEVVTFRPSANYGGSIARAEIRVTSLEPRYLDRETYVIPVDPSAPVGWTMPAGDDVSFAYTLRVYDARGRFDETAPATLARRADPVTPILDGSVVAAGEGDSRLARRGIPLTGGTVTVSGADLPPGATVRVAGRDVPVDAEGRFVTEVVVSAGTQDVTVALDAPGARPLRITREVDVPRDDWEVTGLIDVTIGQRGESLSDGEGYETGRVAGYVTGVVNGDTRVTASIDTGEDDLDELFSDLLNDDPRDVLKRIDRADLYPTYGDDSTIRDDTPTSGGLYVRVEREDSHIVLGDFEGRVDGTDFLGSSRDLYGVQGVYRSPEATASGERRLTFSLYGAQPETRPQRDELRGTNGSVYFLKRADVVPGSETLSVETIDPTTGRVISSTPLARDGYRIDYLQGTVILDDALPTAISDGRVIGDSALGDVIVSLVAQYEFTPALGDEDGTANGGRVEYWLPGDTLRFGATIMNEATDGADLEAAGINLLFRLSEESFVEAEIAQSDGTGFGRSLSTDGGLSFTDIAGTGGPGNASAARIEGRLALSDLSARADGLLTFYLEDREEGFTTLTEDTAADEMLAGFSLETRLSPGTELRLAADHRDVDGGTRSTDARAELAFDLRPDLELEIAAAFSDRDGTTDDEDGSRTDLGLRLTRQFGADAEGYVFAQGTVDRSGDLDRNNRLGVGGSLALNEAWRVGGELSDGTDGLGARASIDHRPEEGIRNYLSWELDPGRTLDGARDIRDDRDRGTLILGTERQLSDALSFYVENDYDLLGDNRGLTEAYGVRYTPNQLWSFSADLEHGEIEDPDAGDFERTGLSFALAYTDEDVQSGRLRLEWREDDSARNDDADRETWAVLGSYGYELNPEWRLIATMDALFSESDQADLLDGRYVEASLGFAYRPIANDRFNMLARYTFLDDQPGADQVSADGSSGGDRQRSHIVDLDAIWEVSDHWELGAGIAFRRGEVAARGDDDFTSNDAGLAALRATYAVDQKWDITGEARWLTLQDGDQTETGALLSVHRSIGNNAKIGLGYNFGSFSDDLRDTDLDDEGIFLNIQLKM